MIQETIVIIDYGSGNLRSAQKAFEHVIAESGLNHTVLVSSRADDVLRADRIVLPGQGAFGDCISHLRAVPDMTGALERRVLEDAVPFLGICVGMQLLAHEGLEHGRHEGLGWIDGQVVPLADRMPDPHLKIPHMGWNTVELAPYSGPVSSRFVLCRTGNQACAPEHYYFVHSFVMECKKESHVLATTEYGATFPAAVGRDNILGVQFHPEKSQKAGLRVIRNFLDWKP